MSTIDNIRSREASTQPLDGKGLRIAIAVAEWNSNITMPLLDGAVERLKECGVAEGNVRMMRVPGAFELTNAATRLKAMGIYDAVIVIGCVVRGDTPHFDYVCQGVTQGITYLNTQHFDIASDNTKTKYAPVIFCVLTTDTMEQAEARAGGALGNKGTEAADAAIMMCRAKAL